MATARIAHELRRRLRVSSSANRRKVFAQASGWIMSFSLLSLSDMIAIKVSSENIQELWKCPDVSELVKTVSGDCTKQTLIVRLRNREFYVPDGFYLVKDENDQWSTLSPSLYELIKDKVHGEK
jgi:hypothetical protein